MRRLVSLGLLGMFLFTAYSVNAQTYAEEALIFSRISPGGSARIQAMGGSQVALGGDYSSAFSNPAGLGFFNRSEATFSLGTSFYKSTSTFAPSGTQTGDSKSNFNIPGFSIVFHSDKNNGKLVSGNFGISYSRTNNFNQSFTYQGMNPNNSLIDYFVEQANGVGTNREFNNSTGAPVDPYNPNFFPSQFRYGGSSYYNLSALAFNNYLLGPNSDNNVGGDSSVYHKYLSASPLQREHVQTTGSQSQLNFSYALNYGDFFYFGATIGLPSFNYHSIKDFSEDYPNVPNSLAGYGLHEDYSIKGSGVNATFGAIVKPKDFFQFGISVATPTYFYSVSDNYSATISSTWNNYSYVDATYHSNNTVLNGSYSASFDQALISDYTLTTPWRLKGGATFFIKKRGLITLEVESVNYGKSTLTSQTDGLDFTSDNQEIKTSYAVVLNYRLGGEIRFNNFRGRLGGSYMPSPYTSYAQNSANNSILGLSAGVGYRTSKFFVDLAAIQTRWDSSYVPYTVYFHGTNPLVTIQNTTTNIIMTVGLNL